MKKTLRLILMLACLTVILALIGCGAFAAESDAAGPETVTGTAAKTLDLQEIRDIMRWHVMYHRYDLRSEEAENSRVSERETKEDEDKNPSGSSSGTSNSLRTVNGLTEGFCSFDGAGTDAKSLSGDDYTLIPVITIRDGVFDPDSSNTNDALDADHLKGISVSVRNPKTNGILLNDTDAVIEDARVLMYTLSEDGSDTCDFTGKGSALAVYGSSDVTVKSSTLMASGVAGLSLFVDRGASVLLDDVKLYSLGGTIYSGYVNTPAQDLMVSSPWVLGITGNSRCTNLMGETSTMTVMNSLAKASNWAVFSTDMGHNLKLNVINTKMELEGSDLPVHEEGDVASDNPFTSRSGYGTYVIGDADEEFLGVSMNVGTYATIFTGGTAQYRNLVRGESYPIYKANGDLHCTYTASKDIPTQLNSDTFGFMAHQGTNECVLDGVTVNSGYTGFLVKSGTDTAITIRNGAKIHAENGILLQLMENDDATTAFDDEHFAFGTQHEENPGFPTEAISGNKDANTVLYHVEDTELEGALYNASGWITNSLSEEKGSPINLTVTLSGTSVLRGPIASTSCIHASFDGQKYLKDRSVTAFQNEESAAEFAEEYQETCFSKDEYYNIGQVANLVRSNGKNTIDVVLEDSALWHVTDCSLISSVQLSGSAQIVVEEGANLTVGGKDYESGTYTAKDF